MSEDIKRSIHEQMLDWQQRLVKQDEKIAKLESDLAISQQRCAAVEDELTRVKDERIVILTPAQCEAKIKKLEEDLAACKNEKGQMYDKTVVWDLKAKLEAALARAESLEDMLDKVTPNVVSIKKYDRDLAAQSTLISQMREVLEEAKGCLATLLWDAVKHEALSKSMEKYEGIGKRITDVLALSESAAEPAPEAELDKARRMAKEAQELNHAGYHCMSCGSFWTMTGYGKEWHEPGCNRAQGAGEK